MNKFFKHLIFQIKNLDKLINSYKENAINTTVPSKAFLNWGIHLALEGKINDALEKFEMSSNMPCTDPEVFTNWGIALAKLHRFEEAVGKFDEALGIDKTYSSAYSLKGAALVELGKTDEAIDCYSMAIKYAPYDPEIYINWGVALARIGQKAKAEQQFKKALSLSMTNVSAAFLLAVVLYEQNKFMEAINAFNHTIKLDNKHVMAFYYLSLTNTKIMNYKGALDCALITVQLAPFRVDFMVNLAECYYDMNNLKETMRTYRTIETIAPDAYPFLVSAGIFWQKVKKFKRSLKYLEEAIKKPQVDYLTKYYYAITLAGLNRFAEAKDIFLEITVEKPDFYDGLIKLAILYKNDEEYDKAIEILENLFEKTVHFNQYFNLLAECYLKKSDIESAIKYYKKMIEYYPEDIEAHLQLAQIYFNHNKDIKNALKMVKGIYDKQRDDIKINTLYALILTADGAFDSALEKIDLAISLDENNLETYLRKIYILKCIDNNQNYIDFVNYTKEKFAEKIEYIDSVVNSY